MSINIKGKLMKKSSEVISSKLYCQKSVELEKKKTSRQLEENLIPDRLNVLWKRLKKSDCSYQKLTKNKIHG